MADDILASYKNGNCDVTIYCDGTKTRYFDGTPLPEFPESIDLKITNYCTGGCVYCHEESSKMGNHGDLTKGLDLIRDLPAGVEMAIGGGDPLEHPQLYPFLKELMLQGIISNITVNHIHMTIPSKLKLVEGLSTNGLIKGLGISYRKGLPIDSKIYTHNNTIFHLIIGFHSTEDLLYLLSKGINKVLLLGYKNFGRGCLYYTKYLDRVEDNMKNWYLNLPRIMKASRATFSFDNLAIEQLHIKRLFTKNDWERFYMGDDGKFTMYLDLVSNKFAKSSTSSKRMSVCGNIRNMFSRLGVQHEKY